MSEVVSTSESVGYSADPRAVKARERYRTDADYRERVKKQSRDNARRRYAEDKAYREAEKKRKVDRYRTDTPYRLHRLEAGRHQKLKERLKVKMPLYVSCEGNCYGCGGWFCVREMLSFHKTYLLCRRCYELARADNTVANLPYLVSADMIPEWRTDMFERAEGLCQLCGFKLDERTLVRDHIIPVSKGGADIVSNFQAAHFSCNIIRFNNPIAEFPSYLAAYNIRELDIITHLGFDPNLAGHKFSS